jgi:hypothetical protein
VCAHAERARIELALANDPRDHGCARIARDYGLCRMSVWRHWKRHVPADRKERLRLGASRNPGLDLDALKRREGESLLANLVAERVRLLTLADAAEVARDFLTAIKASSALLKFYDLQARLLGEIRTGGTTINTVFLSGDWFRLRRVIAEALRPFPDAQRAVLTAVRELEAAGGAEVNTAHAIELPPPPVEREERAADA